VSGSDSTFQPLGLNAQQEHDRAREDQPHQHQQVACTAGRKHVDEEKRDRAAARHGDGEGHQAMATSSERRRRADPMPASTGTTTNSTTPGQRA
jgi:hypothetical protein